MIGEDAGRLEAMGKAIRKLYGPAVEPLMAHVDEVLVQAKRMAGAAPGQSAAPRLRAAERWGSPQGPTARCSVRRSARRRA